MKSNPMIPKRFVILLYGLTIVRLMSKLTVALFVTAVLMASIVVVSIPAVSALTARTSFNDNHYTVRYAGGQKICGDHICAPGEFDQMQQALSEAQMKGKTETSTPPPGGSNMTATSTGQNPVPADVCGTVKNALTDSGVPYDVIGKVMTKLGCS